MTQLMITSGRCQFCHRASEDVESLIGGDSSFICNDCLALASKLLTPPVPTAAEAANVARYLSRD
ncbi:MAG: ClpX C4-type zinc finger protein [Steroidobacteraceae bacterium]